jgi:hypothetical protein
MILSERTRSIALTKPISHFHNIHGCSMSTNKYFYNKMIETEHTTASYPLDQTKGIKQVMLYNNPADALEAIPNAADTTESEEETELAVDALEAIPNAADTTESEEETELAVDALEAIPNVADTTESEEETELAVDALKAIPNAADTTESEEDTVLVTKEDDDERTELCPAAAEKEGDDEERELRPAAASEQSTTSESSLSTSSGKARHSGGNGNKPIPNAKIAQSVAAPLAGTAIADKEKSTICQRQYQLYQQQSKR